MKIYIPSMEQKAVLDQYLTNNNYPGCEFSAANNILWSGYYETGFTIIEDMLCFCRIKDGKPVCFSFPVGAGDARHAFDAISNYYESHDLDFCMYLVLPEMFEQIEGWYPGKYEISYDRNSADYLYEYKTLAELKGKKLHGKRNHINAFIEQYPDYEYEDICEANIAECEKLADDWAGDKEASDDEYMYEVSALKEALHNMGALGLSGGLIRAGGRVVAFTIGEPLTGDTYVIHFEKAYADVRGAYAIINREFVRRRLTKYKYINREEDMGIPGLRHAKTTYQPVRLVEKGVVTLRKA